MKWAGFFILFYFLLLGNRLLTTNHVDLFYFFKVSSFIPCQYMTDTSLPSQITLCTKGMWSSLALADTSSFPPSSTISKSQCCGRRECRNLSILALLPKLWRAQFFKLWYIWAIPGWMSAVHTRKSQIGRCSTFLRDDEAHLLTENEAPWPVLIRYQTRFLFFPPKYGILRNTVQLQWFCPQVLLQ